MKQPDSPYGRFEQADLVLRDELAIDRTILANERTLLAYARTALALAIAGVSMMHFSDERWYWAIGVACVPTAFVIALLGVVRWTRMARAISTVRRQFSHPRQAE